MESSIGAERIPSTCDVKDALTLKLQEGFAASVAMEHYPLAYQLSYLLLHYFEFLVLMDSLLIKFPDFVLLASGLIFEHFFYFLGLFLVAT